MFCGNCGTKLPDDAMFCPNCGTKTQINTGSGAEAPAAVDHKEEPAEPQLQMVGLVPMQTDNTNTFMGNAMMKDNPAMMQPFNPSAAAEEPTAAEEPVAAEEPAAVEEPVAAEEPAAVEEPVSDAVPERPVQLMGAVAMQPDMNERANELNMSFVAGTQAENGSAAPETEEPVPVEAPVQTETPVGAPVQTAAPVETPVQTETSVETPVQTVAPVETPVQTAAPVTEPPAPKKKSKAGPVIGISAAVVVLGGAAAGYFLFHSDITRLFMGDAGYAKMLENNSYASVFTPESEEITTELIAQGMSAYANNSDIVSETSDVKSEEDAIASISGLADEVVKAAFGKVEGVNGISADISYELSIENELTKLIGEEIEIPSSFGLGMDIIGGDVSKYGLYLSDGRNERTGGVEFYTDGKNAVITLPQISDISLKAEINDSKNTDKKEETPASLPDKSEIRRLKSEIASKYFDMFDKAEIEVKKDDEIVISGSSLKGTSVTAYIKGETIAAFRDEVMDLLANDSYLISYFTGAGISEADYKKNFETEKKEIKGGIYITNFTDVHNNFLGKKVKLDNEKETAEIVSFSDKEARKSLLSVNIISGEQKEKTNTILITATGDEQNGTINFKHSDNEKDSKLLSIDVNYSGIKKEKFLDKPITTGTVKACFASDNESSAAPADASENQKKIFDALNKSVFEVSSELSGSNTVSTKVSVSVGDLGSFAVNAKIKAVNEQASMPDVSSAKKFDEVSSADGQQLLLDAMKWIKKNPAFDKLIPDEAVEELEDSLAYYKNYSDYEPYDSVYTISDAADQIYSSVCAQLDELDPNRGLSGTAKVYFDADGNAEIIDAACFDKNKLAAALSDIETRKTYAEINYNSAFVNSVGVTAVYTDDKNNIPAKLPDMNNFSGGAFGWNGKYNEIDFFAVGTRPYLSDGEPDFGYDYDSVDKEIALLNSNAAACAPVVSAATLRSGSRFLNGNFDMVSLVLEKDIQGWHAVEAFNANRYEEPETIFSEEYLSDLISSLNNSPTIKRMDNFQIEILYFNKLFVGINAADVESYIDFYSDHKLPSPKDFDNGSYSGWAGKSYIVNDVEAGYYSVYGDIEALGTYCVSAKGPLPAAEPVTGPYGTAENEMAFLDGAWYVVGMGGIDMSEILSLTDDIYSSEPMLVIKDGIAYENEETAESGEDPLPLTVRGGQIYMGDDDYECMIEVIDNDTIKLYPMEEIPNEEIDSITLSRIKPSGSAVTDFTVADVAGEWEFDKIIELYESNPGLNSKLDEDDIAMLNSGFRLVINADGSAETSADGYPSVKYTAQTSEGWLVLAPENSAYPAMGLRLHADRNRLFDLTTNVVFRRK